MGLFEPIWTREGLEGKKLDKALDVVRGMTSQQDLCKVVVRAHHGRLIEAATRHIDDQGFLARVALGQESTASESALYEAARHLKDQTLLSQVARLSPYKLARIAAIERMVDPIALLEIASDVQDSSERKRAIETAVATVSRCDDQEALARIALISFYRPLALAAVDRISDHAVLAELALSDLEIAESAARRLEPARFASDREALVRIAVEAAQAGARKAAVQLLGEEGLGVDLLARIVLNDPGACNVAADCLRDSEMARTMLVEWVGEGALAADRSLAVPKKDALSDALVKVVGLLATVEDARLAAEVLGKMDSRRFGSAAQAAQRRVQSLEQEAAKLERRQHRIRCTRCGQPVIFAIENSPVPQGAFACGCEDGPDAAFWEEYSPDSAVSRGEYVWVCSKCHGLASDMSMHKVPQRGQCNCPDRPRKPMFGVLKKIVSWTDYPENAMCVDVVEMASDVIEKLPPLKEDGVRRIEKSEPVKVLVCPICGKDIVYSEGFESIDSYRTVHGFSCKHGCGMHAADGPEALYKFKVVDRHPDSIEGEIACLCSRCGKAINCEVLQQGHTYATSCSSIKCAVKCGKQWRAPTYLDQCSCMYPSTYTVVRINIDY